MSDIAEPAPVHDGRFFLFRQKPVEFRVVAGCNNQGINRPFKAINFNGSVLDYTQIHLNQIFFVFENFIAEMNAAAGNPRQRSPAQIEPVRIVGIAYMHQALNGFLSQKVNCGRCNFILGRILSGNGSQAFYQRDRNDLDKIQHFGNIACGMVSNIIPYISRTCAKRAVVVIKVFDFAVRKADFLG